MRRLTTAIIFILYLNVASAQDSIWYVAAKSGLSLRAAPSVNGRLVSKLTYGEKLVIEEYVVDSGIFKIEGFESKWLRVSGNGKKGYVASAFLFPMPPPANNIKTIRAYLNQVSREVCTVKYGEQNENAEEKYDAKSKTLYRNGAEVFVEEGYEWGSATYVLPAFNIQTAFQLLRLIPEFPQFITATSVLPVKNQKTTGPEIKVYKREECQGEFKHCIQRIRFYSEDEVMEQLELFELGNEIYISYESGV
jgi:hypothetical protein